MNPISENIRMRCKTNIRTTGCSCEADAAAIERLVLAAEKARVDLAWLTWLKEQANAPKGGSVDTAHLELNAALAAFRESEDI